MSLRSRIAPLVLAVLHHLEAWMEVAGEDVRDAAGHVSRRLLRLLIAVACAFVAFLMLCAWILVLAWDGPWRSWVAGGLAVAFAVTAAALAWPAFHGGAHRKKAYFLRIRAEFSRDRELLERSLAGKGEPANGGEHAAD